MPLTESDLDPLATAGDRIIQAGEALKRKALVTKATISSQEETGTPLTNAQKSAHIPDFVALIQEVSDAYDEAQLIADS